MYDLMIIGAGPAGMSAAIYARRGGLNVVVVEAAGVGGGQVLTTTEIDNYPGMPGIMGEALSDAFEQHAKKMGAEFVVKQIRTIEHKGDYYLATGRKFEIEAKAVILATGADHAHLGLENEDELAGRGLSYCATCDGAFYKEKEVAVVGGGDVALGDAIYLSKLCKKVTMILRRNRFRGAKHLVDRVNAIENVEIIYNTRVKAVEDIGEAGGGETNLCLSLVDSISGQETDKLQLAGLFIAVGIVPQTELYMDLADLDDQGYVLADESGQVTKNGEVVKGLYVAGDARKKPLRQIVTAVADGANAATAAIEYLAEG